MTASLPLTRDLIERSLAANRHRVAVIDGSRRLSYAQLAKRTARLGNALLAQGAGAERPAASLLPNLLEGIEFDVACARAGVTRVALSERLGPDEVRYILEHSGAAVLLTTPSLLAALDSVPASVNRVVVLDGAGESPGSAIGYEDLVAAAADALAPAPLTAASPCYIMYTSGTTGRPKGAVHTQATRAAGMVNMLACELTMSSSTVMAHVGPISHGSGSKVLATIASGGANLVVGKFSPQALAEAVELHGASHTFLVPTMLRRICDAPPEAIASIRGLSQISFGGSPIAPGAFSEAIEKLGPILTQVYGSSEAPHPVTLLRPDDYRGREADFDLLRSAGRVSAVTEIRTVADDGSDVTVGEPGELLIRSGQVMEGYWRDAEATAAAFAEGGWYRSGDVARIDGSGVVTFEDRKKDMIITGGLNVYPSEVERVLAEHEEVREAAVLGYPDPEWGESIIAFVVPAAPGRISEDEVKDWVRRHLAGYKRPRRVVFRGELPLGSSNKVLKRALRDELWAGEERQVG